MSGVSTVMSNRTYDALKYLAQIAMPAAGTLYFALSQIWGFPYGEEIVGTIVALNAFLGVLLGLSTSAYISSGARYDGTLDIVDQENVKQFLLNVDEDPYDLEQKDEVVFRVNRVSEDV